MSYEDIECLDEKELNDVGEASSCQPNRNLILILKVRLEDIGWQITDNNRLFN